ncbi:putative ATP synthase complex subunit h [Lyophyllum shimeji]|uniref:ATP synthase complex subunit h n=1 Tax=Lyophyllum shimeji TaxID=47721 RepID=A0A9P3PZV4_LYOSH|nr:putative ATP synthase complex subunit h [Lyophyllum shimeji]
MSAFLRQATTVARTASVRAFSSTSVARRDIVQELYLRELKSYKPPAVPKDAHVGVVKQYTLPPAPQPPMVPTDLASELATYEAQEPTKVAAAAPAEEEASGAEEFLTFLEQDLPKEEAHH